MRQDLHKHGPRGVRSTDLGQRFPRGALQLPARRVLRSPNNLKFQHGQLMLSLSHSTQVNICRPMVGQRTYDACCMNCVPSNSIRDMIVYEASSMKLRDLHEYLDLTSGSWDRWI